MDLIKYKHVRPLFIANWSQPVFVHFKVNPESLQKQVPFELDIRGGNAWVSLVAFEMKRMRFFRGDRLTAWMTLPIATHRFLNVRTYVVHHGEPGIYFLAEWVPNCLSRLLGPFMYGLPYRLGKLVYELNERGEFVGEVVDREDYRMSIKVETDFNAGDTKAKDGSLDAFLLERYTAYTVCRGKLSRFRIHHTPWMFKVANRVVLNTTALLDTAFCWLGPVEPVAGHLAQTANDVWMGRLMCVA